MDEVRSTELHRANYVTVFIAALMLLPVRWPVVLLYVLAAGAGFTASAASDLYVVAGAAWVCMFSGLLIAAVIADVVRRRRPMKVRYPRPLSSSAS